MIINNKALEKLNKSELIALVKESVNESESLEYLLNKLSGISWELDLATGNFTYVSSNTQRVLGYEASEWIDFESWKAMLHVEDREETAYYCENETQKGENHFMEYRMVKKSGEVIWVLDVVTVGKDEQENPIKLYGFILDITENKNTQLEVKKEHKYLQTVINGIADPVMIIKNDFSVELMNDIVREQIQGKTFLDPDNPKCYEISHGRTSPCDDHQHECPLAIVLETKKAITVVHNHTELEGSDKFIELNASPLFDENEECVGIIESSRDITSHITLSQELRKKTKELNYQATHDYLTGLPNRALFMDRLEEGIKDCKRNKTSLALFFLDLDFFKEVNDTFGHNTGDKVLCEVSERFLKTMRESDTLSRLGGDEFTVIMKNIKSTKDVSILAKKLIALFEKPLIINGNTLDLSVSIGISTYPENGTIAENLLKLADSAMYEAKKSGKNTFEFFV